jgi:outer membrane receptor protein involved in Fe transport
MKSFEVTTFAVMGLLGAQIPTGWAQAQTAADAAQLQEVVITAERRESDVQKTATSVSVRSGSELQDQGRYTLGQILEDVPGVTGGAAAAPVPGGSGVDTAAPGVTIRGIKSNAGAIGNVTSAAAAAAVYVDGVYEGVGGGYDIDRVEILRGPQGTLYGRSATSGLLAIHTNDPKLDRLGGDGVVELGNFNLQHYTGVVNVPLVDNVLGIRVAGNRYERDGYFVAKGDGAVTSTDAKVKVLYKPNDDFSLLLGYALQNNDTHSGGTTISLSTPDTFAYTPTPLATGNNDFRQYWALLNWNLGFATLTYQPAYRTWTSDGVAYTRGPAPPQNVDSTINVPRDHFDTQELRLSSNPDSKLSWQAGAVYYDNSLSSHLVVKLVSLGITPIDALVREKTTSATGVFAEATYPVAESWRVTAGARYDQTKVSVVEDYASVTGVTQTLSGEAGTRRFNNFTYKARLEHDLTAQNLLYASVSTGFSPGDVSVSTGASGTPFVVDLRAETLTAYEIGSKNRFLDNRLQVNGAVYYYDYGAYQTAAVNINNTGATTAVGSVTLAAPAKVLGGELETIFQLTPSDRAALNLAYTDAYFVDKNRPINAGPGTTVTFAQYFTRDEIPDVTPFTANLSYDHVFRLPADSTLTLHGAARYLSGHALINLPAIHSADGTYAFIHVGGQWVEDLSATWASASKRFSVTGYARNIGDNQYKSAAFVQDVLGVSTKLGTPYDPRTYGAVLNVHF